MLNRLYNKVIINLAVISVIVVVIMIPAAQRGVM
jgi:hypothetical protein